MIYNTLHRKIVCFKSSEERHDGFTCEMFQVWRTKLAFTTYILGGKYQFESIWFHSTREQPDGLPDNMQYITKADYDTYFKIIEQITRDSMGFKFVAHQGEQGR